HGGRRGGEVPVGLAAIPAHRAGVDLDEVDEAIAVEVGELDVLGAGDAAVEGVGHLAHGVEGAVAVTDVDVETAAGNEEVIVEPVAIDILEAAVEGGKHAAADALHQDRGLHAGAGGQEYLEIVVVPLNGIDEAIAIEVGVAGGLGMLEGQA